MSFLAGDSAAWEPSSSGGGAGGGTSVSLLPLGVAPRDLQCPICVETIQDAYVTPCGHSFCFQCLGMHLRGKSCCPSCGAFMTQEGAFPNFLLNKVRREGKMKWPMEHVEPRKLLLLLLQS